MDTLYYGTKKIKATPMDRATYNTYRGWELPSDEDGSDAGYLVEDMDSGKSNHPDHIGYILNGYISWSPKEQFDAAYQSTTAMNFGHAIQAMKDGYKVARTGWNGQDMFVFLVNGSNFIVNREPLLSVLGEGTEVTYEPHIDIRKPDGKISTWVPSIGDVMAEDWEVATI